MYRVKCPRNREKIIYNSGRNSYNNKKGYELSLKTTLRRPWLAQRYEKYYMNNLKYLFGEPIEYFDVDDDNDNSRFNYLNIIFIIIIIYIVICRFKEVKTV